jgi:O-6-methylguanine DNA methyltransferase
VSAFRQRVLAVVRRIPAGRVATYGDVAELAGRPRAWRAVGNIMRNCHDFATPCHRVIGAAGALGGFGGSLQLKRELLRAEGIEVGLASIRRFHEVRWRAARATGGRRGTKRG